MTNESERPPRQAPERPLSIQSSDFRRLLWRCRSGRLLLLRRGGRGTRRRRRAGLSGFLLLLRFGRLGGKLGLTLTEHLHQFTPGLFVFDAVDGRTVISLGEAGQRHGKTHRLLLDVHGGHDHLLALAYAV